MRDLVVGIDGREIDLQRVCFAGGPRKHAPA